MAAVLDRGIICLDRGRAVVVIVPINALHVGLSKNVLIVSFVYISHPRYAGDAVRCTAIQILGVRNTSDIDHCVNERGCLRTAVCLVSRHARFQVVGEGTKLLGNGGRMSCRSLKIGRSKVN